MHLHISTGRQGLTAQAHSQPIKRVCGSLFYIFIHYVYKWPEAESMFIDQTDTKSSSGRNAVTRYREAAISSECRADEGVCFKLHMVPNRTVLRNQPFHMTA